MTLLACFLAAQGEMQRAAIALVVDVNLYGCLPAIKSNLHCFVMKSAANLYLALLVEFFNLPDRSTGPDAYPLANTSSILRAIDALVDTQV